MLKQTVIAFAALSIATGAHGQPVPPPIAAKVNANYDFKGARLGMSLAEWKALPLPVRNDSDRFLRYSPTQAVCLGDPATTGRFGLRLERSRAEEAANVIVCAYARQVLSMAYKPWMKLPISIGETFATRDVEFRFVDGSLYRIDVTAHTNLLKDVLDGLNAKWGKPDSVVNDTTQNRMGATFAHTIQNWTNGVATIRLESPVSRIDELNVTYSTLEGAAKVEAVEKAINPAANKM